jgi:hypothetical protein
VSADFVSTNPITTATKEARVLQREESGKLIDPATAEIGWAYSEARDPYGGLDQHLRGRVTKREYFARTPDSDIWVWFGDLPGETAHALRERHARKIAERNIARKEAGILIDPATAEMTHSLAEILDPYGDGLDLPDNEARAVMREYFVRAPGSDIWVWLNDLPDETAREAIRYQHERELDGGEGEADPPVGSEQDVRDRVEQIVRSLREPN